MTKLPDPTGLAQSAHADYYALGAYDVNRYEWTVATFFSSLEGKRVLEIGCGSGGVIAILQTANEVHGVDASETGVVEARKRGLHTLHLDVSSQPLPFPTDYFDVVICLETLEHLMNPYYAALEARRVLREGGRLVCSVPNPRTGHPFLYPGLFEFPNFRTFLDQVGFRVDRIEHWQWVPRDRLLPVALRRFRILRSRYVTGVVRRVIEFGLRRVGVFPAFLYWLWTFECTNERKDRAPIHDEQAHVTKPGRTQL